MGDLELDLFLISASIREQPNYSNFMFEESSAQHVIHFDFSSQSFWKRGSRHHRRSVGAAVCFSFGQTELLGAAHDFSQRLHLLALIVDEQLGVTDDVDEQDMPDLEFYFGRGLSWHEISFYLRNQI